MNWLMLGVLAVLGLVDVACFLVILIQLFKRESALKGIWGIICGAYTFFYGWKNASSWDLNRSYSGAKPVFKSVMLVWTICAVAIAVLSRTVGS